MFKSVFEKHLTDVYAEYDVTIGFHDRLAGSIPSDPVSVHEMVRRQMARASGASRDAIDNLELRMRIKQYLIETGMLNDEKPFEEEDIDKLAEQKAQSSVNVFRRDEGGLVLASHCVKAAMKEAINIKFAKEPWGKTRKGPMNFFVERVFIEPDFIPLFRDGQRLTTADGENMTTGIVSGAQGKRSIITQHEYVERAEASFVLFVLKGDEQQAHQFLVDRWPIIWKEMEFNGIGPLRKFSGFGRFAVTRFDERVAAKPKKIKAA